MEYINNMELANALYHNPNIKVQKRFFGLKTVVIYTQTNSTVVGRYQEFDNESGRKIQQLLESTIDKLNTIARKLGHPQPVDNGKYCLSMCFSQDHQFVAMQLSQYVDFDYHPVGSIRFAEGEEAEMLLKPFVA